MRGSVLMTQTMSGYCYSCPPPVFRYRHDPASGHQHGVAKLDVAYDQGALSIELEAPLDVLLGFERAPRPDAERKSVEQVNPRPG